MFDNKKKTTTKVKYQGKNEKKMNRNEALKVLFVCTYTQTASPSTIE